jgi:hypothetical protein
MEFNGYISVEQFYSTQIVSGLLRIQKKFLSRAQDEMPVNAAELI